MLFSFAWVGCCCFKPVEMSEAISRKLFDISAPDTDHSPEQTELLDVSDALQVGLLSIPEVKQMVI